MKRELALLLLLTVLLVVQTVVFAPRMPDPMPSHFGTGRDADGWMSPLAFFALMWVVHLVSVGPIVLVAWLLPRMPDGLINLPHKDRWLAAGRREATLGTIRRYILGFAAATLALMLGVVQATIVAALGPPPARLPEWFGWLLGGYFAFTALWLIALVRRFARPPGES